MFATAAMCLFCAFAPSPDDTKVDKSSIGNLETSRTTLESFAGDDAKLRATFRELNLEHKRLAGLAAQVVATKAASVNGRTAEIRSRNATEAKNLQKTIDAAKPKYDKTESDFKKTQNALLDKANAVLPAIRSFGDEPSKQSVVDLLKFTDLFIFDSKHEIPNVQASASFIDQAAWKEAATSLGKQGKEAIPALKKALGSPNVGTKYAAAVALGEMGPIVNQTDSTIVTQIADLKARTHATAMIDRTERNRREKVLGDAIERIRSLK